MNQKKITIAILALLFLQMSTQGIVPALAVIKENFNYLGYDTIQLLVTIPNIFLIISSMLVGTLAVYLSQEKIALVGVIILTISGILPIWMNSFFMIVCMRALIGLGSGVISTTTISLISRYYEEETKEKMLGVQSTFICGGGIVFSLLGGIMAARNWRYAFGVYAIGLVVFFIVASFLPHTLPSRKKASSKNVHISLSVVGYFVAFFLYGTSYNILLGNLARFLSEESIGDTASAGLAMSLSMFGGAATGVLFQWISKMFKGYVLPAGYLLSALGLLLLGTASSLAGVLPGCTLLGVGMSIIMPAMLSQMTEITRPEQPAFLIGISLAIYNIGSFSSPYIVNSIMNRFEGYGIQGRFLFGALLMVLTSVAFIIHKITQSDTAIVKKGVSV
ncbi:MAG: hypothetical protein PWQ68_598 [Thermoanaerobacteraceae bacterium]|jgi:MFS family permease|nr:hypothetical protein [Thermoanaerobacteraceae bacterium]